MLVLGMHAAGAQQAEDLSCGAAVPHQGQHVGAACGGQLLKGRGGAQEEPTDDGQAIATAENPATVESIED